MKLKCALLSLDDDMRVRAFALACVVQYNLILAKPISADEIFDTKSQLRELKHVLNEQVYSLLAVGLPDHI